MNDSFLAGGVVQRVDVGPHVALLRVRLPGETRWVILATGKRGGVGVVSSRPWRGAGLPGGVAPEGEKTRMRARIEGARVVVAGERSLLLDRGGVAYVLEAPAAEGSRVTLVQAEGAVEVAPAGAEALEAAGSRLSVDLGEDAIAARRAEVARAMARARARVGRRIEAVRGDLGRIGEADAISAVAALMVAEASRAPRGATRITATDWSSGEPREVALALDPARPARDQVDAMFKRARRLKQGAVIAGQRLREAEEAAARIDALRARVEGAQGTADLEGLVVEARRAAPKDFAIAAAASGGGGGKQAGARPPFRTFRGSGEARILVGRGAAHNDALTFHVARPHDLWLHAKGRTGAHVVVPIDKNHACPSDLLVDAAHLAAHFSDARGEATVEIQHTPRRYLRKPKGSAPGLAVVDREKVMVLRVDADRLARLLAAEDPA